MQIQGSGVDAGVSRRFQSWLRAGTVAGERIVISTNDAGTRKKENKLRSILFFFFEMEFRSCYPGWSAMA